MERHGLVDHEFSGGSGVVQTRRLLQSSDSSAILSNATIRFSDGKFSGVESNAGRGGEPFPDTLIVPAFANAHDHGRGLKTTAYGAFDDAVEAWVPATYTIPKLDPYPIAALAFARMAKAGITSIVHCHLSSDPASLVNAASDVARAARDVGVRVAFVVPLRDRHRLGYGPDDAILAHMPTADRDAIAARWLRPIPSIATQLDLVEQIAGRCEGDDFIVQYGPVGMEWCSDALLSEVARAADASHRRIHMHMLESRYQRNWADQEYSEGPVRRLETLGLLSPRLTLAHGVWLRPDEHRRLADNGVTVSINTSSNLRLKSGIAPLAAMNAAGLQYAIGLDSLALDDDDDILREFRLAHLLHAGTGFDARITRENILHAGCMRGACVVCDHIRTGHIATGTIADFVVFNYPAIAADIPARLDDPFMTFFSRARADHIAAVISRGKLIVRNGRVPGIDESALQGALFKQVSALSDEIAGLRPLLQRFRQGLAAYYERR